MEEKFQVDTTFLQQQAQSYQQQLLTASNQCEHVEESLQILKYMLEKRSTSSSNSNNVKNSNPNENQDNIDASTGRPISID